MSHFYGDLQGNRRSVTRGGSSASGISCHVRGWDIGCRAVCYVDENGDDCVKIYVTSGSNGEQSERLLDIWQNVNGDFVKVG